MKVTHYPTLFLIGAVATTNAAPQFGKRDPQLPGLPVPSGLPDLSAVTEVTDILSGGSSTDGSLPVNGLSLDSISLGDLPVGSGDLSTGDLTNGGLKVPAIIKKDTGATEPTQTKSSSSSQISTSTSTPSSSSGIGGLSTDSLPTENLLNGGLLPRGLSGIDVAPSSLPIAKRDSAQFVQGQPIDANGKGGPILGGTNHELDLQNPDNLGRQPTDAGIVPNLKWSFSDSKTRIFKGGWVREQVITDLPQSHDIAAAQQHLKKGALRELHWHRVAEWGIVYAGSVLISAVDETGKYEVSTLNEGDIWYFPKGVAHTIQGVSDENEYLLVFDEADFDKVGTTFMVDDWIAHTPPDVVAKNFGLNDSSIFGSVPTPDPYIFNGTVSTRNVTGPEGPLTGNSSFVYRTYQHPAEKVPGGGGEFRKIDSTNFPVSKTIAATVVRLAPKGLRELHWHPNAEEWLYFHQGHARATVFIGGATSRTFDFSAGDTAAFPDNSGHYIENTSDTEELVWIEIYKSDRVADIPLTQWLALTPADIVAQTLKVPISFVEKLKKEKQVLVKG